MDNTSITTKLKNLSKLYKDGVLTKSQFEKAKKKLLNLNNTNKALSENEELYVIMDKIERLTPGDYYLFAHSTTGEKFWGSTKAINKKTQKGVATSSSGYSCKIISKQKTSQAPYKGYFDITCPNENINGSWTQDTAYSPGIGQAFTDKGDVITAFFSYKQSTIIDFAKKYYSTKETQIAKAECKEQIGWDGEVRSWIKCKKEPKKKAKVAKTEPKQKEFKPKETNLDNEAPIIKIAKTITVNDSNYEIVGKVSDKSNKIFIQVDGRNIPVNKGKFKIKRFSPVDEQISIVATDQWGNRSEPKLVNIIVDLKDTVVVEKIESLDPSKLNTKTNIERVALIIGIEKYDQTPEATFANLDAKYFYEYARKGFGISKSNIKLLVDEEANLIDSLGTINKWLPGKIKKGKTELIIFFAGHGLASNDGKELYLLPQDGDPDLLARTALSRTELFQEIINLNPKSVTMFLDTCYSGVSRNERTLLASARPVRIVADDQDTPDNFTIFSASQLDQISSGLDGAKHGIFSYYLMKGLEGKADTNKDKKITNGELIAYMDENVSQKASELGRQQNPSLAGDPNKILISYR